MYVAVSFLGSILVAAWPGVDMIKFMSCPLESGAEAMIDLCATTHGGTRTVILVEVGADGSSKIAVIVHITKSLLRR